MERTLLRLNKSDENLGDSTQDEGDGAWVVQTVDATCDYCSTLLWLAATAAAVVILITTLVLIYVYRQAAKLRARNRALGVRMNPSCYEIEKDMSQLEGQQHQLGKLERHVHTPGDISIDATTSDEPQKKDPSVIILKY